MISKLPPDIWKDYDPLKEPLDIEVINEWEENEISFKEVYFTGRKVGNEKVRIYAVFSEPGGNGKKPGILHVHGGGQTVSLKWLKYWSGLGYAAVSYNWGGEWPDRERYTLWGPLTYANHKSVEPVATKHPGQAYEAWYEWTAAAMRALTFLEAQPGVDRDRLGAFGTSMGGSVIWRIAAIDKRLKAACAIYGCGWEEYSELFKYDEANKCIDADPQILKWNKFMAPEAYAPYINVPIMYLSSTNDFWGNMDRAYDTLGAIPDGIERRQAFTPCYNHHVGAGFEMNLPLWMDKWLKNGEGCPCIPRAEILLGQNGVPELNLSLDAAYNVRTVDIYYAIENTNTYFRHWRKAKSEKTEKSWQAFLPVMDIHKPVFAFANVVYTSGITLSSNLAVAVPQELGQAKASDLPSNILLEELEETDYYMDGWVTNSPSTDPVPPVPIPMKIVRMPDGTEGIALQGNYSLHTYKVGDPKWRGKKGGRLHFWVMSRYEDNFIIIAGCMKGSVHGDGSELFCCNISLEGTDKWQDFSLPETAFKSKNSEQALNDWSEINYIQLKRPDTKWKDENIIFSDFKWM